MSGTLVIGVGNAWRGDDGAGPGRRARGSRERSRAVRVHEGEPIGLLEAWAGADEVIVVDAVASGAPPGTVHRLDAARRAAARAALARGSTHAFGLAETIELARALGRLPAAARRLRHRGRALRRRRGAEPAGRSGRRAGAAGAARTAREARSRTGGKPPMPARPRRRNVGAMEAIAPIGSYLTPSFEHARVADAMRPRVLTCDPQTTMVTVAQRMASEHVHAIVVLRETVDAEGAIGRRPWGILTDRDVLRCAAVIDERTADDVALGGVLLVHPDDRSTTSPSACSTSTRATRSSSSRAPTARSACCRRSTSPASSAGAAADPAPPLVLAGPDEVAQTAAELIANRLRARPRLRMLLPTGRTPLGVYAALRAHAGLPSGERDGLPARRVPRARPGRRAQLRRLPAARAARHRPRRVPRARRRGGRSRRRVRAPPAASRRGADRPRGARPRPRRPRRVRRARLAPGRAARASSLCIRGRAPTRPRSSAASSTSRPTRSPSACARCSPRASCCVLVTGEGKAEALRSMLLAPPGSDFPASLLRAHPRLTLICDAPAASALRDVADGDHVCVVLGHRDPGISHEHRISRESLGRVQRAEWVAQRRPTRAAVLTGYTSTGGLSEAEQMRAAWRLAGRAAAARGRRAQHRRQRRAARCRSCSRSAASAR